MWLGLARVFEREGYTKLSGVPPRIEQEAHYVDRDCGGTFIRSMRDSLRARHSRREEKGRYEIAARTGGEKTEKNKSATTASGRPALTLHWQIAQSAPSNQIKCKVRPEKTFSERLRLGRGLAEADERGSAAACCLTESAWRRATGGVMFGTTPRPVSHGQRGRDAPMSWHCFFQSRLLAS